MVKYKKQIEDNLGEIIKQSRIGSGYSREQIAERVEISLRYLIAIENEKKKPSFDILFLLIRELNINADSIFFPESKFNSSKIERLIRLLHQCDDHEIDVIFATTNALMNK